MDVTNIAQETEVYRVVVGPGGSTHPILGTIPEKGSFPMKTVKTGTITTENAGATVGLIVSGVGTLFNSELDQGDYLTNADGVLRRIKFIFSDTLLELEAKFPASLAAAAVNWVPKAFYKYILAESTGTANAVLQEQAFAFGTRWLDEGAPVSYDVSTASSQISFTLSV